MPPEPDECDGKRAGDRCDIEGPGSGVCETRTCSRLQYGGGDEVLRAEPSDSDGDELRLAEPPSSEPHFVDYDCLQCVRKAEEAPASPVKVKQGSTAPGAAPQPDTHPPASEPATGCRLSSPAPSGWTLVAIVIACIGRRRALSAP